MNRSRSFFIVTSIGKTTKFGFSLGHKLSCLEFAIDILENEWQLKAIFCKDTNKSYLGLTAAKKTSFEVLKYLKRSLSGINAIQDVAFQ